MLGCIYTSFGQSQSVEAIKHIVAKIDTDGTLTMKEFDIEKLYNQTFDGGGRIVIGYNQNELKKIKEEIGTSFGRVTTIIYLNNGTPVKVIEREENFKWKEDDSGWDYSELHQVFQADYFIFNWEMDEMKIIKTGQPNLSDRTCAVYEHAPLIERALELMKKQR